MRSFEDKPAIREATPLLIGLAGASGSGKTFSALRLATGIQQVSGGDIYIIDTEARRALHYAEQFKFRHLEFKSPFGPLDYLAAIEHCKAQKANIIIVDSMSHEHEGPGGVLEMHETELARLSRGDDGRRDKVKLLAWQKPKAERRRLLNTILQMPINFIFCFRAKDKTKPGKDKDGKSIMIPLGWMPIAGEEFVYEMTVNILLYPASGGIPTWKPDEVGERAMVKLPTQFLELFPENEPLSEQVGGKMAFWAAGGRNVAPKPAPESPQAEFLSQEDVDYTKSLAEAPQAEPAPIAPIVGEVPSPPPATKKRLTKRKTNEELATDMGLFMKAAKLWKGRLLDMDNSDNANGRYYGVLGALGVEHANGLRTSTERLRALEGWSQKLADSKSSGPVPPPAAFTPQAGPAPGSAPPGMKQEAPPAELFPETPPPEPPTDDEWTRSMRQLFSGNPRRFLDKIAAWSLSKFEDIPQAERQGRLEAMRVWLR